MGGSVGSHPETQLTMKEGKSLLANVHRPSLSHRPTAHPRRPLNGEGEATRDGRNAMPRGSGGRCCMLFAVRNFAKFTGSTELAIFLGSKGEWIEFCWWR